MVRVLSRFFFQVVDYIYYSPGALLGPAEDGAGASFPLFSLDVLQVALPWPGLHLVLNVPK